MLEILAVERFAARFDRGGENERVVEGERMLASHRDRGGMSGGSDRDNVAEPIADDGKGGFDLRPRASALPVRDMRELVEHLGADDAPLRESFEGAPALLDIQKCVDENVGVEEQAQRSFASSRSNL